MARVKIALPETFHFSTTIALRITDINYGGHMGNDALLSIIHEARMQFLQHLGYSETNLAGIGLIMADVAVEFKNEAFYGDVLTVQICANDFSRVGFDLCYKLQKETAGKTLDVAYAKTGMVCFDYTNKKVSAISAEAAEKLKG